MTPKTTRNHKDTVFSSLFYDCKDAVRNAKALYKALTGRTVKSVEKCRLEDVLFREFKNDVAYIMDGKLICFIEHQSSINPNMPLRILIYVARTYERKTISNEKLMYSSQLIKIPTPEFYVLYNGTEKLANTHLKLSDAFDIETDCPDLELKVNVVNINYSNLKDTELEQCKPLYEYSYLVEKIREYKGDVAKAVDECIKNDVLADYLTFYGSEVINMLYTEYDSELAKKVLVEETAQEAEARGRAEGKAEFIKQMLQNGFTAEKIISMFHLSKEETNLYFGDAQTV